MFAFSVITPAVFTSTASADAKSSCKQRDRNIRQACVEGYNAGKNKKNNPCNRKQQTLKSACTLGFERGKREANNQNRPNNNNNGGGGNQGNSFGGSSGAGPCSKGFFGLVPWWKYIQKEFTYTDPKLTKFNNNSRCEIKCFNVFPKSQSNPNECGQYGSDIPYVLLAIVDNLLRIAGMVAVVFVIIGSIRYITSQGNPEDTASAQSTVINALIGMAIAIVAVALVSFIGNKIA